MGFGHRNGGALSYNQSDFMIHDTFSREKMKLELNDTFSDTVSRQHNASVRTSRVFPITVWIGVAHEALQK